MIFVFSKHASDKMQNLDFKKTEIVEVVLNGRKWIDKRGDKSWHAKYFGIEAAYKKYDNVIFIKTIKYPSW